MAALSVTVNPQSAGTKTPSWLHLSFEQRTRYEYLTNPFRLNASGTEKHLPLQTRLKLETGEIDDPIRVLVEFQDSRIFQDKESLYSVLTNINEHDFLQAQLQLNSNHFLSENIKSRIILGRFTMNLGKRRLMARNKTRNTTNAFDGVSWKLDGNRDWTIRTFLTRPVRIEPYNLDSSSRRYFWGAYFESTHFPKIQMDAYYFGTHDPENSILRHRHTTVGGRIYKMPTSRSMDYEIESAWQFGKIGLLDHSAWFYHGELGFSFNASWNPRVSLHYDYASGDNDPADGTDNRFYSLYGARGFEYAHTGIYGPIYRSNIKTPGLRIELHPTGNLQITSVYRAFQLAQEKDAWVGSGLRDISGNSGKSLGQSVDIRIRWKINRYLTVQSVYARFFKGSYLYLAPGSPGTGNSHYFYIATEIKAKLLPI